VHVPAKPHSDVVLLLNGIVLQLWVWHCGIPTCKLGYAYPIWLHINAAINAKFMNRDYYCLVAINRSKISEEINFTDLHVSIETGFTQQYQTSILFLSNRSILHSVPMYSRISLLVFITLLRLRTLMEQLIVIKIFNKNPCNT